MPGVWVVLWLISLIVAFGLARSVVGHFFRIDVVEEHRQALLKEEKRHLKLLSDLAEATSAAFVEKQAREKLGLAKPGDSIVLLQDEAPISSGSASDVQPKSNWERWWRLFF